MSEFMGTPRNTVQPMTAADDLTKYALNRNTVGIVLKRTNNDDDCLYNEFSI